MLISPRNEEGLPIGVIGAALRSKFFYFSEFDSTIHSCRCLTHIGEKQDSWAVGGIFLFSGDVHGPRIHLSPLPAMSLLIQPRMLYTQGIERRKSKPLCR